MGSRRDGKAGDGVLVAEVLGPAGAGKTTLLKALAHQHPALSPIEGYRSLRLAPTYARVAAVRAPLLWTASRGTANPTRWINWMIRLECSDRVLQASRPARRDHGVVLFDQGPVYSLMRLLREPGMGRAGSDDPYGRWWQQMLNRWAALLDVVIVVDARDDVLLERIQSRPKWHAAKDLAPERARALIADHRARCETVTAALGVAAGPEIVRIDTTERPLAESIAACLEALTVDPATGSR